jgi:hypothetical protein
MGERVVGQAKVKIDGDLLDTDGATTLDVGGPMREPVTGDYQAGGFREKTEPSKLEMSLLVKERLRLSDIRAMTDVTITVEYDTGQTWIIRNGYSAEVPSINTSEGKAKVVFQGPPAEEIR